MLRPTPDPILLHCTDCDFNDPQPQRLLTHMADEHGIEHPDEFPWVDDHGRRGWTERTTLES